MNIGSKTYRTDTKKYTTLKKNTHDTTLKSIEDKIGRYSDPLLNHPYYQEKIKLKQENFDKKTSNFLEAGNEPVLQPMVTDTCFKKKIHGTH